METEEIENYRGKSQKCTAVDGSSREWGRAGEDDFRAAPRGLGVLRVTEG